MEVQNLFSQDNQTIRTGKGRRLHKSNQPRVSIHIISFNQKDYIAEAIESAISQDYENLEVIVSDDASTDGSAEIIAAYQQRYPNRLVALLNRVNVGITGNSNRGLRACTGEYIAFQGGDDVLLPGKITRQVEWLEADSKRVLCYHDMDVFDSSSGKTLYLQSKKYKFYTGGADTLVSYGTYFGATTAMVKYPHVMNIFFNSEIPIASDWLFWIDVVELQQGEIGYIDGVYARYRRHRNNITSVSNHGLIENLKTLEIVEKKYPHYRALCKKRKSLIHLVAAYNSFKSHQYIALLKHGALSFINCKGNLFVPFSLTNKL